MIRLLYIVLIDCGGSHNFISSPLISRLGLSVTPTREFVVTLGIREHTRIIGIYSQLCLYLLRVDIVVEFFPLSLGATYMN